MESKKRKREISEPPRITYDAATRTFDRLFKEDSLDAMKSVVRKKLGLSVSAPVFLSQWREGKAVDLEDDDDFEAFSAAARSSTSVVVKVFLGENQTEALPSADENETPSASKRKRKKKSRREGSASPPVTEGPSEENIIPNIASELVPAKKRRVSFAADAPELGQITEEKLKKKGDIVQEKSASLAGDTTEHEQSEKEGENGKKKKKKKNKKKNKQVEDLEATNTKASVEQPVVGLEIGKKIATDSAASNIPSNEPALAVVTESGEPTPQPKKSKKRSRTGDVQDDAPVQQPVPTPATDESERPTKKAKKKKTAEADASDTPITDITVDATTTTKTTSETVASTPQPSTDKGAEELKKKQKKKQKVTNDLEDNSISETVQPGAESKNLDDTASEKPKKSAKFKPNISPSEVASDPTRTDGPMPASSSTTVTSVPVSNPSDKAPPKKSKKKDKEKTDAMKPTETSLDPKGALPRPNTKSKKNKDTEKDSESSVAAVMEDVVDSSKVSNGKSTKKASKQKKLAIDTTEQAGTTEGQSTEQANAALESAAVMKEATRLAVLNVLKKAAEKVAEKAASSSPSSQTNATQSSPTTSEITPVNHPTKAPTSSDSSKSVEKPRVSLAKSAKESDTCPICETSPFHARTRCPVIKSGIRAMRKKVADLEQDTSEEGADSRASIILELQGIIDRRTKKPRASDAYKPVAAEAESVPPGKESEAVSNANVPCPVPTSGPEPSTEADADATPTAVVPPASVPRISGTPFSKPISTREIMSQKSQPTLSSRATSSQKPVANVPTVQPAKSKPIHIAEIALGMELSGFGDMSQFTDKDLDALIRGPRLSIKNSLPTSDTGDESEQEDEVVLEEDVAVEDKSTRNASRVEYPSSSDETEDEEEDEIPTGGPTNVDHAPTAAITEEAEENEDEAKDSEQSKSFQDINALGSSVEPDRTGNHAVHAAVGADLASINEPEASQKNDAKDSNKDSDNSDSDCDSPSPSEPKASPAKVIENVDVDPIEPSDPPTATQPRPVEDLILSDDEEDVPLSQSTPKSEVFGRTRSQRTAATAATTKGPTTASQPPASQSKVLASKEAPVEETAKPRTRGMKKLTEIPVPPNPAVRVIRQAAVATPRTRRQLAQEKEREEMPEESEVTVRTRSSAAAVRAKTPAKAPPKTPAKTPARAKTTAKPLSKQGKSAAPNGVPANQEHGLTQISPSSPGKRSAGASWAVLQESVHSQVDTDNGGQIDELLSSPTIERQNARDHGGKGEKPMNVNGSEDPLFIPAESQQSFPYSQFPLEIPPTSQAIASPNDSDDENEVALAVVKTSSAPQKQAYRSLTDIASQSKLFAPRPSQILKQVTEPQDEDLFGRKGQESEESDSGSDSDDDNKKRIPSHIPAARRAGVAVPKKK